MKYTAFLLAFFGWSFTAIAQHNTAQPLTIGEIRTLHSKVLQEERVLNIHLPEGYDPAKTYPVFYLLDGTFNEDFLHIVGLTQFFRLMYGMPDCIVVGIANIDRKRDFTFHTDVATLQKTYPTTGHSDVFIQFLEEELQPFINKNYRTSPKECYLIGQSLGGLLASEILLKKPHLFTHYLIVSPSLWWDDESLLKQAPMLLQKQRDQPVYVYLSVGKKEPDFMLRVARSLKKTIKQSGKKNLTLHYQEMPDDNHATILHRSIYMALEHLFPYKE